jgi:hypothetical protein
MAATSSSVTVVTFIGVGVGFGGMAVTVFATELSIVACMAFFAVSVAFTAALTVESRLGVALGNSVGAGGAVGTGASRRGSEHPVWLTRIDKIINVDWIDIFIHPPFI